MSKNYLQVRLSDELEEMKRFLIEERKINLSEKVREFLVKLYGLAINQQINQ